MASNVSMPSKNLTVWPCDGFRRPSHPSTGRELLANPVLPAVNDYLCLCLPSVRRSAGQAALNSALKLAMLISLIFPES
eukprot:308183-Rhodomonas_salina.1